MNISTALKGSAEHGGPIALSASVAALTVALVSSSHGPEPASAARPGPTVTVTVQPRTTAVTRPSASPTPAAVVPVADRIAAMPHNASGGLSHRSGRPPSAPSPSPAATPCSGQTLTVRVRQAACVTIGGGS